MCFNPAKTWYNGWFEQYHETVDPLMSAVELELVGIDDASNSLIQEHQKVVVKIKGNGEHDHLFLMFNRKKGINEGVAGSADQLIITSQKKDGELSKHQASRFPGQYHTIQNWKDERDLVVQVHDISYSSQGDFMRVSINLDQPPTNPPTPALNAQSPVPSEFRIKSNFGDYCLVPEDLKNGSILKVVTCSGVKKEYWGANKYGQIINAAKSNKCIEKINQQIRLQKCVEKRPPPGKQQFGFSVHDDTFFHKGESALVFHLLTYLIPENQEVTLAARQFNPDIAQGQKWTLSY